MRTDEAIVEAAIRQNLIVATTDSNLIKRLRKMGIPIVYIKNGRLKSEGPVGDI